MWDTIWENNNEEWQNIESETIKYYFLTTFLACSNNPDIWNDIIKLADKPWADRLFKNYAELVELQSNYDWNDEWFLFFFSTILSRWEQSLLEAYEDVKNWKEITENSRYSTDIVAAWAFIKSLLHQKSWETMSKEEFNENPYFELVEIKWWEIFKENNNPENKKESYLNSEDIYKNPDIFWPDDYAALRDWIYINNHDINPAEWDFLIKKLPEIFADKNNIFYWVREIIKSEWDEDENSKKKKKPLISVCRMNDGYFWTHYSKWDYIWDFGIWWHLGKHAINEQKKKWKDEWENDRVVSLSGFINNKALELQVNKTNFIINNINPIKYDNWSEEFILWMEEIEDWIIYESKDREKYTDDDVVNNPSKLEKRWFKVFCLDSNTKSKKEYEESLNQYIKWINLNSKYVCTRLFYERKWKKVNMEKTYLVFEEEKVIKKENVLEKKELKLAA